MIPDENPRIMPDPISFFLQRSILYVTRSLPWSDDIPMWQTMKFGWIDRLFSQLGFGMTAVVITSDDKLSKRHIRSLSDLSEVVSLKETPVAVIEIDPIIRRHSK